MKTRSQSCGEIVDDDFPRLAAWLAGLKNEVRIGHVLWGRTGTVPCTVYQASMVAPGGTFEVDTMRGRLIAQQAVQFKGSEAPSRTSTHPSCNKATHDKTHWVGSTHTCLQEQIKVSRIPIDFLSVVLARANSEAALGPIPSFSIFTEPNPQTHGFPHRTDTMISDADLYSIAIFLGCVSVIFIVLYHFIEVNANKVAGSEKETAAQGQSAKSQRATQ